MEEFGLYVVMTDPVVGYEACAEAAVNEGIRYVQLRMKKATDAEVLDTARAVREITRGSATRFIVNDSLQIAMDVDADGVHLGQGDMPLEDARERWQPTEGDPKLFGWSTHNEEQQVRALELQPDYIGVGPIFATPTKALPDPVIGLARMQKMLRNLPLTAVAIGGIDLQNLPGVLDHGATNFCAVRAIMQSSRPADVMRRMMELWEERESGLSLAIETYRV